ncbi:MAG: class I SAM-dependent methyltransferase [Deltaproteobacteria bacterium]|nr:class I SAM-dependent methyltransferase [Deltaproteobacteria bacterium]
MTVFEKYAEAYDALYTDKDYAAECRYLETLWQCNSASSIQQVLDVGCGTGGHSLDLVSKGYSVVGLDRSEEMLAQARAKAEDAHLDMAWHRADLRSFNLERTFDAAIAMFAVMGYQTRNADLIAALGCVHRHLKPGGLFIWDAWYGPAVLTQRPHQRIKRVEVDGLTIYRMASPKLDVTNQTVTVAYHVLSVAENRVLADYRESHCVRFFFPQELRLLLNQTGFALLALLPFLQIKGTPTVNHWNMTVVAQGQR